MKTIEINIYKFSELSEESKQRAINNFREHNDIYFIYDDAKNTVDKFIDIFGVETGRNSWLDVSTNKIDDNILNLTGLRLRTYIINNFYTSIFSGKYIRSWYFKEGETSKQRLPLLKTTTYKYKEGKETKQGIKQIYKSKINITNDCELTGHCYDYSILQPVYDFLAWKDPKNDSTMTFDELMTDCFNSLKKDIENEENWRNSDECIIEDIEANDYDYNKNGTIYR